MANTIRLADLIRDEANRDAASFAEEFPGELLDPAKTDWDATAWAMAASELRAAPGWWELYRSELVSAVHHIGRRSCG